MNQPDEPHNNTMSGRTRRRTTVIAAAAAILAAALVLLLVLNDPAPAPDADTCDGHQKTADLNACASGLDGTATPTHDPDECRDQHKRDADCSGAATDETLRNPSATAASETRNPSEQAGQNETQPHPGQAGTSDKQTHGTGACFVGEAKNDDKTGTPDGHAPCTEPDTERHGAGEESGTPTSPAGPEPQNHPDTTRRQSTPDQNQQHTRNTVLDTDTAATDAAPPGGPAPVSIPAHRPPEDAPANTLDTATTPDTDTPEDENPDTLPETTAGTLDTATTPDTDTPEDENPDTPLKPTGEYLLGQRIVEVGECGEPFVSPGEQLRLRASGFAAGTTITFTTRAESFAGTNVANPVIPAATADPDGALNMLWTIPAAPAASIEPAPRIFWVDAAGLNPGGGTHSADTFVPFVAYPATPPCAAPDTAVATLGEPVTIAVLANDTVPTGGSLDTATMRVLATSDKGFAVDTTAGVVTYAPPPGFYGSAIGSYVVYDTWKIGVRTDITVTVAAGCTVTGTAGVVEITGTEEDDVICVPNPDDRRAFHTIYGLGGNDIILGGDGTEWIYGGEGADTIYGEDGDDRIVGGAGIDTIYGGAGMDHVYSLDRDDVVVDDDYELHLTTQNGPVGGED